MHGTPTVRWIERSDVEPGRLLAAEILDEVARHDSHGSSNYYRPWLGNYFASLHSALGTIAGAVKPAGRIGVVVQNSHYKEINIDLQGLVAESMSSYGRRLMGRRDFAAPHLMSNVGRGSQARTNVNKINESLLVFE